MINRFIYNINLSSFSQSLKHKNLMDHSHRSSPYNQSNLNLSNSSSKCSAILLTKPQYLEKSLKLYDQLMTQNIHLKHILFNQTPHKSQNFPNFLHQTPNQTKCSSQSSDLKLTRYPSSNCLNSTVCNQSSYQGWSQSGQHNKKRQKEDIRIWSIKNRNQYLQQKLDNLQDQYWRQKNVIQKIINSEKWQKRFDCKESNCYQDKYIKLLRVKSPVLID